MSGTTISNAIRTSVVVGSAGYVGPVTVTGTGSVTPGGMNGSFGVELPSVTISSLDNQGLILGGAYAGAGTAGAGIILEAGIAVNTGQVAGGNGYAAGYYTLAGAGGAGVTAQGGSLVNYGTVQGGNGGDGHGGEDGYGTGGLGGNGMVAGSSADVINHGSIAGGLGGQTSGQFGNIMTSAGFGVVLTSGATLQNDGSIAGGASRGSGSDATGATGVYVNSATVLNQGQISGANAYNSYAGSPAHTAPGGNGAVLVAGVLVNSGTVSGGDGGAGGDAAGQAGGDGVVLKSDAGFTSSLDGLIEGGAGSYAVFGAGGAGGNGVVLYGGVTGANLGIIEGGVGAASPFYGTAYGGIGAALGAGAMLSNGGAIDGGENSGGGGVSLGTGALLVNGGTVVGASDGGTPAPGIVFISPGMGVKNSGGRVINTGLIIGGEDHTTLGLDGGAGVTSTGLVINYGTIEGGTGNTAGGAVDGGTLVVEPDAAFIGLVNVTTLEVAGTTASTLSGIGSQFEASSAIIFVSGSQWTMEGDTAGFASGQAIDGFAAREAIVLDGFSATSYSYVSGVGLELADTTGAVTLDITGSFDSADFTLTHSDGDTTITTERPGTGSGLLVLTLAAPPEINNSIGQTALIAGISVSEADNAPFEVFTVRVGDTNGLLLDTGAGVSGSGTGELTISGSLDQVNADLAALSGFNTVAGTNAISVNVTDGLGNSETSAIAVYTHAPPEISEPVSTLILNVGLASSIGRPQITAAVAPPDDDIFTVTINSAFGLLSDPVLGLDDMDSGVPSLTFSGSLAAVNDVLDAVYDFDATPGTDTISLHVTDGYGATDVSSIAVTVNGLPTISAPGKLTIEAGQTTSIGGISISESGNTEDETFDVAIYASDAKGYVALGDDSLGGYEETSGSLEQVNAALATLRTEFLQAGSDALDIRVTGGNEVIAQIALTIESPPTITLPSEPAGELSGDIGETLAISGIGVTEAAAAAGETFTVLLTDAGGTLSATGPGVSGAAINALTVSGSLAQVNADLASLRVLDTTVGQNPITISVSDSLGNTAVSTLAVTANGAPTISSSVATLTATAGTLLFLDGIAITGQVNPPGKETVTITSEIGVLSFSEPGSTVSVSGNGSESLTLTGTEGGLNSAFGEVSDSLSVPGADDQLTISVTDTYGLTAVNTLAVSVSGAPISTLSTTYDQSITLNSAAFSNALYITETGAVLPAAGVGVRVPLSETSGYAVLTNAGRILGGTEQPSVVVDENGRFTNTSTGVVQGPNGPDGIDSGNVGGTAVKSTSGSIDNLGIILGGNGSGTGYSDGPGGVGGYAGGSGVSLAGYGILTNAGTILGGNAGNAYGGNLEPLGGGTGGSGVIATGIVINTGIIQGGAGSAGGGSSEGGYGKYGANGGDGGVGVLLSGTLFNAGYISGGAGGAAAYPDTGFHNGAQGDAVKFNGVSKLAVESGAVFDGQVVAVATLADVLELDGIATLSGIGSEFVNFQQISFASGTSATIEGNIAGLAAHETISGFAVGDAIILDDYVATSASFVSGIGLALSGGAETFAINTLAGDSSFSFSTDGTNTTITAVAGISPAVVSAPTIITIGAAGSASISGISLSASGDTAEGIIMLTLADTNGTLFATGEGVSGSGTKALTLSGSLAQVNADLATLHDLEPTAGYDTITFGGSVSADGVTAGLSIANDLTIAATGAGYSAGDVHIHTFDGLLYDFQATGEFVLARSTSPGNSFQIQMQAVEYVNTRGTSVAAKYAAQLGDDVISFTATSGGGLALAANGVADTALMAGEKEVFAGGTLTAISATSYKLSWNTGETLSVTSVNEGAQSYLNANVGISAGDGPGSVQGLMGTDSGQANDFALPDGTVLQQPLPSGELLGAFAAAWRVTAGTSILGDDTVAMIGSGQQTQTWESMMFASAAANRQTSVASGEILTGSAASAQFAGRLSGVTFFGSLAAFQGDRFVNFGAKDAIDITGLNADAATLVQNDIGSAQLQIKAGSATAILQFGTTASGPFQALGDGHGGTLIWRS